MEAMRNNTAMTPVYTKSCRGGEEEELRTLSRVYCVETHLSHFTSLEVRDRDFNCHCTKIHEISGALKYWAPNV